MSLMMRSWTRTSFRHCGSVLDASKLGDCFSPIVQYRLVHGQHPQVRSNGRSAAARARAAAAAAQEWLAANPKLEQKITYIMKLYEDFIGLTEVKAAQAKVISAESEFKAAQETRTAKQQRMMELQRQLREIHAELDKTARGEDRHLQLLTKEHAILKEERLLVTEFRATEKREHDLFSLLSFALRESHEKERAQAEKTKYWSIIGSIIGTIIGVIATTISNQYRAHQLRQLVTDATSETVHCRDLIMKIKERIDEQNTLLRGSPVLSSAAAAATSAQTTPADQSRSEASGESPSETHVLVGPMDRIYEQTVHIEMLVRQTSLVNTALISAAFIVIPFVGWVLSR